MDEIRKQLECRACNSMLFPPFLMCVRGETVCDSCRKQNKTCPLCKKRFTNNSNSTLEALAHVPCFKCGSCKSPIKLVELREHYNRCSRGEDRSEVSCPIEKCEWKGTIKNLADHWRSKRLSLYPYVRDNVCHMKLTNYSYFCNILEAEQAEFSFKCLCNGGKFFWALQYIGDPIDSKNYCYEIEVFNPNKLACKFLLTSFAQSITIENHQLFEEGSSIFTPKELLKPYLTEDGTLFYNLRVSKVDQDEMEKYRRKVNKLLEKYGRRLD